MTDGSKGTVAVAGLGSMGYGAATSLLKAGFAVRGVDVRAEVMDRFAADGGTSCLTPAEAASEADAFLTFVVDSAQTDAVLFGTDGAVAALRAGSVVLACATVPPAYAEALGRRLAETGVLLVDAPVSGGAAKAAAGEMTVMASGDAAAFAKAEAVLAGIAAKVYRLGDAPGQGSRVKMINQLLAGIHIAAACEAMTFGHKNGIDGRALYDVIVASAGNSWMFENRVPHILDDDYAPRSAVDIFVKDLGIVLETGRDLKFPLPLAAAAQQLFTMASGAGHGRDDDAAVAKVYAATSGVTLPAKGREPA